MIVVDQVKKIKEYLLAKEKDDQKSGNTLGEEDYRERIQTINNIGPTMNDVVEYCFDDGWGQDMVCSLIFKCVFGESWESLDWYIK